MNKAKVNKKVNRKNITLAIVCIKATFNNTKVTFADVQGNTIHDTSAGASGFTGPTEATPYAAQVAVQSASNIAKEHGVKTVSVRIQGAGSQREAALREVFAQGFVVTSIMDVSPIPHNGCRPPKRRRV